MYDALTQAIVAAILASPINAIIGGRIYPSTDVPPDAAFPRAYIAYRRPPNYSRFPIPDGGIDRKVIFDFLFASRKQDTAQLTHMIEVWDAQARPYIEAITIAPVAGQPRLVYVMRVNDGMPIPQSDDRNTYVVGGGQYESYFQEN